MLVWGYGWCLFFLACCRHMFRCSRIQIRFSFFSGSHTYWWLTNFVHFFRNSWLLITFLLVVEAARVYLFFSLGFWMLLYTMKSVFLLLLFSCHLRLLFMYWWWGPQNCYLGPDKKQKWRWEYFFPMTISVELNLHLIRTSHLTHLFLC